MRKKFSLLISVLLIFVMTASLPLNACAEGGSVVTNKIIVGKKASPTEKDILTDYYMYEETSIALFADGHVEGQKLEDFDYREEEIQRLLSWENIADLVCEGESIVGIRRDGSIEIIGFDEKMTEQMAGWDNVKTVVLATCYGYAFALQNNGNVLVAESYPDSKYSEMFGIQAVSEWHDIVKLVGAVCGDGFSVMALGGDGTVKTAGLYSSPDDVYFHTVSCIENAVDIDTSGWINLCLLDTGRFMAWGVDYSSYVVSMDMSGQKNFIAVAAGDTGSVAVEDNGSLCWLGYDPEYYDLYDGLVEYVEKINSCKKVEKVFMDGRDLYIIKTDGSIETIYEDSQYKDKVYSQITKEVSEWEDIESFEFSRYGYDYVIGRKADGSIVITGDYAGDYFD